MIELAKVTSKGQITIPIEIRKKLSLKSGDRVIFVEKNGHIEVLNSTMAAFIEAQKEFKGEAERSGLNSEEDVVSMIKELRGELS